MFGMAQDTSGLNFGSHLVGIYRICSLKLNCLLVSCCMICLELMFWEGFILLSLLFACIKSHNCF